MTIRDNDPTLETLRSLPRRRASADFTERLLERLPPTANAPRGRNTLWRTSLAAGLIAALGAAALAVISIDWQPSSTLTGAPEAAKTRQAVIAELARERDLLAAELSDLRAATEATRPVVVLGGDDSHLLVLDLESMVDDEAEPTLELRPASYRPY